jgi:hypothetical protein
VPFYSWNVSDKLLGSTRILRECLVADARQKVAVAVAVAVLNSTDMFFYAFYSTSMSHLGTLFIIFL